mgnify:CR=1 FL=1
MLKFNNKISKLSAYIVLLGYLTITTANVFHHHNVELGKLFSSLTSTKEDQNNHINLLGSEVLCAVQFAYNSLHTSFVSFENPYQDFQIKQDIFYLGLVSSKPIKETIFSFCLRAPPFSFS